MALAVRRNSDQYMWASEVGGVEMARLKQRALEEVTYLVDYSRWIAVDETIVSAEITHLEVTTPDVAISAYEILENNKVLFEVSGGLESSRYEIRIKVTTSSGQVKIDTFLLTIGSHSLPFLFSEVPLGIIPLAQLSGITNAQLAAGVAIDNLGFTPANKAGDTFSGEVIFGGKVQQTRGIASLVMGTDAHPNALPVEGGITAYGAQAGMSNTTGYFHTLFGGAAGRANTTGLELFAIGYLAAQANTGGHFNGAIGNATLQLNTVGSYNWAFCHHSLDHLIDGQHELGVGLFCFTDLTGGGGDWNLGLGHDTGWGIVNGARNLILGHKIQGLPSGLSDAVIIATGDGTIRADFNHFISNQWLFPSSINTYGSVSIGNTAAASPSIVNFHSSGNATPDVIINVIGGTGNNDGSVVFYATSLICLGAISAATSVFVEGEKVLGPRLVGWGAPSGTFDRTALAAYAGQTVSAGYVQAEAQATDDAVKKASQELAALISDLRTHGLIGS